MFGEKLHDDCVHVAAFSSGNLVVAIIVRQVGPHNHQVAAFEMRDLVAHHPLGAAVLDKRDLHLRMLMPQAAEIRLANHLASHQFGRRVRRLFFNDGIHDASSLCLADFRQSKRRGGMPSFPIISSGRVRRKSPSQGEKADLLGIKRRGEELAAVPLQSGLLSPRIDGSLRTQAQTRLRNQASHIAARRFLPQANPAARKIRLRHWNAPRAIVAPSGV